MIILTDCLSDRPDEGCIKVATNLTARLKAHDPSITVLTYDRQSSLSDRHLRLNPLFLNRELLTLLRRKQEHVLYIPFSSNTRGAVLRTFLLAKLGRSQVSALFALTWPMDGLSRLLLRGSGATVFCLSAQAQAIYSAASCKPAIHLRTGVDTAHFSPPTPEERQRLRQKYGVAPGETVVLHVGHLDEGRNLRQLLKLGDECHIFSGGKPRLSPGRRLALRSGTPSQHHHTGRISARYPGALPNGRRLFLPGGEHRKVHRHTPFGIGSRCLRPAGGDHRLWRTSEFCRERGFLFPGFF